MAASRSIVKREPPKAKIEYTIYTFQACEKGKEKWERQDPLYDMAEAVSKAEALFADPQYCKVEIKQKFTDPKKGRAVDMTFKTFERKVKRPLSTGVAIALCGIAGIIAFAVTYVIGTR